MNYLYVYLQAHHKILTFTKDSALEFRRILKEKKKRIEKIYIGIKDQRLHLSCRKIIIKDQTTPSPTTLYTDEILYNLPLSTLCFHRKKY